MSDLNKRDPPKKIEPDKPIKEPNIDIKGEIPLDKMTEKVENGPDEKSKKEKDFGTLDSDKVVEVEKLQDLKIENVNEESAAKSSDINKGTLKTGNIAGKRQTKRVEPDIDVAITNPRTFLDIIKAFQPLYEGKESLTFLTTYDFVSSTKSTAFRPPIVDKLPEMFKINYIPDMGKYVLQAKRYEGDFDDYESLAHHVIAIIDKYYKDNVFIMKEMETISLANDHAKDPKVFGYMIEDLYRLDLITIDQLRTLITPFKMKTTDYTTIFKRLSVPCDKYSNFFRQFTRLVLDAKHTKTKLIQDIEDFISLILNPAQQNLSGAIYDTRDRYLLPFTANYNLMTKFNDVPFEVYYRIYGIQSVIVPNFVLCAVPYMSLIQELKMRATTPNPMITLLEMGYSSKYDEDISIIILSYFCPGYFRIDIDYDDQFNGYSDEIKFVFALFAKVIFLYNENNEGIDSTITAETARRIDLIIYNFLQIEGIVTHQIQEGEQPWWLDACRVKPGNEAKSRYAIRAIETLKTSGNGNGWLNCNQTLRPPDKRINSLYPNIEKRPHYLNTPLDPIDFEEAISNLSAGLFPVSAVKDILDAMKRSQEYKYFQSLFNFFSKRIVRFFYQINMYNLRNYYTSFRMTESRLKDLNSQYESTRTIKIPTVRISATSVFMFLKNLPQDPLSRKINVKSQIKIESHLSEQFSQFYMYHDLYKDILTALNVKKEFSSATTKKLAMSQIEDGFLKTILMKAAETSDLSSFPIYSEFINESLKSYAFRSFYDKFGLNEDLYGFTSYVYARPHESITQASFDEMRDKKIIKTNRDDCNITEHQKLHTLNIERSFNLLSDGTYRLFLTENLKCENIIKFEIIHKLQSPKLIESFVDTQKITFKLIIPAIEDIRNAYSMRMNVKFGIIAPYIRYLIKRDKRTYDEILPEYVWEPHVLTDREDNYFQIVESSGQAIDVIQSWYKEEEICIARNTTVFFDFLEES